MNKTVYALLTASVIGCNSGNSIPTASPVKFGVGMGYVHLAAPPDKVHGFDGQLRGGKLFYNYHLDHNLHLGGEVMAYGNSASNTEETPQGTNEYTLGTLGLSAGAVGGYQYVNHENLGAGIETQLGLMVDEVNRERKLSIGKERIPPSAVPLSSERQFLPYGYLGFGVRMKVFSLCVIPSAGFRTDLSEAFPMGSVSVGYCPNRR